MKSVRVKVPRYRVTKDGRVIRMGTITKTVRIK